MFSVDIEYEDLNKIGLIADKLITAVEKGAIAGLEFIGPEYVRIERSLMDNPFSGIKYTGETSKSIESSVDRTEFTAEIGPNGSVNATKMDRIYAGAPGPRYEPFNKLYDWVRTKLFSQGNSGQRFIEEEDDILWTTQAISDRIAGKTDAPGGTSIYQYWTVGTWGFPFKERALARGDTIEADMLNKIGSTIESEMSQGI